MMFRKLLAALFIGLSATPVWASSGPFFTLDNTNFVVTIAFLLFIAVLLYLKVPGLIGGFLDTRADGIRTELDQARTLREEAQTLLASYERKQKEVAEQSADIVKHAKAEALAAAGQAKDDLKQSIARRLQAAIDQIASAEASAVKEVRDTAIAVAIAAARDVIGTSISAKDSNAVVDAAIKDVGQKLH